MKKLLIISIVALLFALPVFASFDGRTGIGINYGYQNKDHYFGLTTDSVGYINGNFGYFIGVDAGFNFQRDTKFMINMLLAPVYRYHIENTDMNIELAVGLTGASNGVTSFDFGLGGYLGATYDWTENIVLLVGAKMGSNFTSVSLDNGKFSIGSDFFIIPNISIGFSY